MYEAALTVLGTAFLGLLGWAYSLSTKIVAAEVKYDSVHELLEARFDEVDRRLARIEHAMNGFLRHKE